MADTKISALTSIVGADVTTSTDVLPIIDTSVTTTKKILIDELRIALGLATQAQQETATSQVVTVTPGVQQYHPSAPKAWVVFNGSGTPSILSSYNVTNITDNGVGDYTINFTVAFSSTNYGCVGWARSNAVADASAHYVSADSNDSKTASAMQITVSKLNPSVPDGIRYDSTEVSLMFFGDQ